MAYYRDAGHNSGLLSRVGDLPISAWLERIAHGIHARRSVGPLLYRYDPTTRPRTRECASYYDRQLSVDGSANHSIRSLHRSKWDCAESVRCSHIGRDCDAVPCGELERFLRAGA